MADDKVRLRISRSDPEAKSTFLVERAKPMMVLDALLAVQRTQDPSLGFRHSCRVAVCNVCGVRVNGEPLLACQRSLPTGTDEVEIEPLEGRVVLRDLVVEIDQLVDEWEKEAR